jgi:hypothetical protein
MLMAMAIERLKQHAPPPPPLPHTHDVYQNFNCGDVKFPYRGGLNEIGVNNRSMSALFGGFASWAISRAALLLSSINLPFIKILHLRMLRTTIICDQKEASRFTPGLGRSERTNSHHHTNMFTNSDDKNNEDEPPHDTHAPPHANPRTTRQNTGKDALMFNQSQDKRLP